MHHGCIECEHPLHGDVDGQRTLSLERKRTPGCRQVCGYHWGMGRIGVLRADQAFLREESQDPALGNKGEMGRLRGPWRGTGKLGEFRIPEKFPGGGGTSWVRCCWEGEEGRE